MYTNIEMGRQMDRQIEMYSGQPGVGCPNKGAVCKEHYLRVRIRLQMKQCLVKAKSFSLLSSLPPVSFPGAPVAHAPPDADLYICVWLWLLYVCI